MDYPNNKKQRINDADATLAEAAADLSTDLLANILGCLGVKDIMQKRRVNKKWKEAVKMTIVPLNTDFVVIGSHSMKKYRAMEVMTTELPNLQQITIDTLGYGHKYSDGEDPDEWLAGRTADWTTYDIEIVSNFSKLRYLKIEDPGASFNGRYPVLFNSFPLLQKLSIRGCKYLKWDLGMLSGSPILKELDCYNNECVTGNIGSLRVLKDTLEKVNITGCSNVEGNIMDVADFPHLKALKLISTAVIGDIRNIGVNDFSSLEQLTLPHGVYGGSGYMFQSIPEGRDLVRSAYLLKKQRPSLEYLCRGYLSRDSPDWYESMSSKYPPPFCIHFVRAGSRIGYRWDTGKNGQSPCEVNWLDPEPDRESSNYEEYIAKLQEINNEVQLYRGFHQPPTQEEYQGLIEALPEESDVHYWTLEFVDE
jgi:hypothetical protein